MPLGRVKWYNNQKGYGFIQPDEGGADVFIHQSAVRKSGLAGLDEGRRIEFEIVRDKRTGKSAAGAVRVIEPLSDDANLSGSLAAGAAMIGGDVTTQPRPARLPKRSLDYPEDSVGRRMQSDLVSVYESWSVGETLEFIRSEDLADEFFQIYVIGENYELKGVVALDKLLRTSPSSPLSAIFSGDYVSIEAASPVEEGARQFERYDLVEMPVVDKGLLVGCLTIDDMIDVISTEATEALASLAERVTPPAPPPAKPGLSFEPQADGLLHLSRGTPITEREAADVSTLRDVLVETVDEMLADTSGSNAYPDLHRIAARYRSFVAEFDERRGIDLIYAYGVRFENYWSNVKRLAGLRELPEPSESLAELMDTALRLHATLVTTTSRGQRLVMAARYYENSKDDESEYRDSVQELVESLRNNTHILDPEARTVLKEINSTSVSPSSFKMKEVAHTTNFNLLRSILKVAVAGASLVVGTAFLGSTPGAAAVATSTELANACWLFILQNEQLLRGLAGSAGQELGWVTAFVDWVRLRNQSS